MSEFKRTRLVSQVDVGIDEEEISMLTDDLLKIISGRSVNPLNILSIVTQLMISAAKYTKLTGKQKKELVIKVTKNFVTESKDISKEKKEQIEMIFDFVIPSAIDLLVAASKSKYIFKAKKHLLICC